MDAHRERYSAVLDDVRSIDWRMHKPHLSEASDSAVRYIPTGIVSYGHSKDRVFTQYDLVLPCAEVARVPYDSHYTDILVARSEKLFNTHSGPHWTGYEGLAHAEYYRKEDHLGGKLDEPFCGVAPCLEINCDGYRIVLSGGLKTRYTPFDALDKKKAKKEKKKKTG